MSGWIEKAAFDGFEDFPFPTNGSIVYIIYFRGQENQFVPLYVGQTNRHAGRFGDYVSASFSAATDFKVGEAIKYLQGLGRQVCVKYKETLSPREDEAALLKQYRNSSLLNHLPGYDYKSADQEEEKCRIHEFIARLLQESGHVLV